MLFSFLFLKKNHEIWVVSCKNQQSRLDQHSVGAQQEIRIYFSLFYCRREKWIKNVGFCYRELKLLMLGLFYIYIFIYLCQRINQCTAKLKNAMGPTLLFLFSSPLLATIQRGGSSNHHKELSAALPNASRKMLALHVKVGQVIESRKWRKIYES